MAKNKKAKLQLKKLIEQRLKMAQTESAPDKNLTQALSKFDKKSHKTEKPTVAIDDHKVKSDLFKVAWVILIIAAFISSIYFLDTKTTLLANISNKLFNLFEIS
ncbi:MAG TPA: hypothetical protein VJJ80_02710 [Patescibacteria group bacterium]|nr:hypothetical protein [Patescibacteria group bacterium]